MGVISAFKIYEVTGYAYKMPAIYGNSVFLMSNSAYESLPSDLQAVIDEVSTHIPEFVEDFLARNQAAVEEDTSGNPDFEYGELPDDVVAAMDEICLPMLEAKAAELDAAGLDGTGALELLLSFAD
jgi:TRAP-type C4-dicarboxylate transport system substrate-binding protein